jgi:hypothetical protein
MKLRNLINRLEELSKGGVNDNMEVVVINNDDDAFGDIEGAWPHHFVFNNVEYYNIGIYVSFN